MNVSDVCRLCGRPRSEHGAGDYRGHVRCPGGKSNADPVRAFDPAPRGETGDYVGESAPADKSRRYKVIVDTGEARYEYGDFARTALDFPLDELRKVVWDYAMSRGADTPPRDVFFANTTAFFVRPATSTSTVGGPLPADHPRRPAHAEAAVRLEEFLMEWKMRYGVTSAEYVESLSRELARFAGFLVAKERRDTT